MRIVCRMKCRMKCRMNCKMICRINAALFVLDCSAAAPRPVPGQVTLATLIGIYRKPTLLFSIWIEPGIHFS